MAKLGGPRGKLMGRGDSPFSAVPKANIQRSTFDRSHAYKTTFDAGLLIPIYVDEALPGDTFTLKLNAFARLATPLKPLMDNLHMETFFFAVPNRLIWDNWVNFMGEQASPGDTTDFTVPQVVFAVGEPATGDLSDYMGIPVQIGVENTVCGFWHRAYNLIWNEWFRDQNLQTPALTNHTDTPDNPASFPIRRRGKRHDYFTSCLPWPQKDTAGPALTSVGVPVVSTNDPIYLAQHSLATWEGTIEVEGVANNMSISGAPLGGGPYNAMFQLESNRPGATGLEVLVNQLRQGFQIQKLLERDARGGTRYTEIIKSHFGVTSPDSRLQRPEYLGGGYSAVTLNPVAQTSGDDGIVKTPQANLSAIGTASLTGGFHKSFTEHCTILGLVCVRADQTYQYGIDRMWSRSTRFDFYWPALSQIGEQAVLNKEITAVPGGTHEGVFGYQERYSEYRYKQSVVTGLFRSDPSGPDLTLNVWHLAQSYAAGLPVLNSAFIEENPPVDRVIAVQTEPHFLYDSFVSLKCARPMPVFGTPGFVDHF